MASAGHFWQLYFFAPLNGALADILSRFGNSAHLRFSYFASKLFHCTKLLCEGLTGGSHLLITSNFHHDPAHCGAGATRSAGGSASAMNWPNRPRRER